MLSLIRTTKSTAFVSKFLTKCAPLRNSSKLNVSSYRAVIFDMGGVILPSPFTAAYKWEKKHGLEQGTIFSGSF